MSEILSLPNDWTAHADLTEGSLRAFLGDHRLISIKTYRKNGERLYAAISLKDTITGGGWVANIRPGDLATIVQTNGYRVISLDCFWDERPNELRCAAAWLPASAGAPTRMKWGMYEGGVDSIRAEGLGAPICLRTYSIPAEPQQNPPIAFIRHYCAVYVPSDTRPWNWANNAAMKAVGVKLKAEKGRLVSIDTHLTTDPSAPLQFTAVWLQNATDMTWFWNVGATADKIVPTIQGACSYGFDLVPADSAQFATVMYQYPRPAEPGATTLFTFAGTATGVQQDDLMQRVTFQISETNLASVPLTFPSARSFMSAEGGWSWVENTFLALPSQLPLTAPINLNPTWTTTWNAKRAIFGLRAEDGLGGHQNMLVQVPIVNAGVPAPPPVPVSWPVFLGLIEPVECVELTDGRSLIVIYGQICNPTGQPLTVTNVFVQLLDNNKDVHEFRLTKQLLVGNPYDPLGEVINSSAPLIKFHVPIEVQDQYRGGSLTVQVNVKFAGKLDCYGDMRELNVPPATPVDIHRLPYDQPQIARTTGRSYRWRWDHSVGARGITWHSFPEHRYSYDLTVRDDAGRDLRPGGNLMVNADFFAWGEPIRAMEVGVIADVVDTSADNQGNVPNMPTPEANRVVVFDAASGVSYLYAHLSQGSADNGSGRRWAIGDVVNRGDHLGLVGNSGASSGPHLHVGVSRRDPHGFFQSRPMRLLNVTDGTGAAVSGVPAEEQYFS